MLTVGGLFSGIGGWELGLERAGMRVLWHCEADPYARAVLERHWPGVPCYPDVRGLRGADVESVDVLCGGFPCQDLSYAGAGAGIDGARSGLWGEYARLVGELRPRYVLVENVSALLARGLGRVLGDLAALGYDAEWDCLPASAFGAPHQRDRIWLVAYPERGGRDGLHERDEPRYVAPDAQRGSEDRTGGTATEDHGRGVPREGSGGGDGAYANRRRCEERGESDRGPERPALQASQRDDVGRLCEAVADADESRLEGHRRPFVRAGERSTGSPGADAGELDRYARHWFAEPDVGRVAHGIPSRVDRLRCLGNALVPQIAEWIGRRVMAYENANGYRS